jgi:hypothetical protein
LTVEVARGRQLSAAVIDNKTTAKALTDTVRTPLVYSWALFYDNLRMKGIVLKGRLILWT